MPADKFFDCGDVKLHGCTYASRTAASRGQVICLPGLTRNERDFEAIAEIISEDHDVLALSLRGRAKSSYADHLTYHPEQYRDDVIKVLGQLSLPKAIFLGTSLGGITTMLIAEKAPQLIRAAIINDVGPRLATEGIMRISGYMAEREGGTDPMSFDTAIEAIKGINAVAFPTRDNDDAFWRAAALRTFRQLYDGEDAWVFDFDPGISRALAELGPAPDLWPGFKALADMPTLLIRGAISDLLTTEIVDEMRAVHPTFAYAEVTDVGHAPMLDESDAVDAIQKFLASLD